jgi:putative addiction module component (TIGR02574 family)
MDSFVRDATWFLLGPIVWYNAYMVTLHEILDAAQNLPSSERAQLIASLWATTAPEDWVAPSADWVAEANRRSDDFDDGKASGSDWTDVRHRARKAAGLED